jgi:hypothetical protein
VSEQPAETPTKAARNLIAWFAGGLAFRSVDVFSPDAYLASVAYGVAAVVVAIIDYKLSWFLSKAPWLTRALNHVAARWRFVVAILVLGVVAMIMTELSSIRTDLETYAMPRRVTPQQAAELKEYLSHQEKHAVTVKANPTDLEAMEYAAQVFNALHDTEWDAALSTTDDEPRPLNAGLCIMQSGPSPPDPKHDPKQILERALRAAGIGPNCGGGAQGNQSKLFVVVGRRPLALSQGMSLRQRIGIWLLKGRWPL